MEPAEFVSLGRVTKTHGLLGEVAVAPATGLPFVLLEGIHVWFVPPPASVRETVMTAVKQTPKGPLIKCEGIESIDGARDLVGREVLVRAGDLPEGWEEPDEGPDDVGLTVTDVERGLLGEVIDVIVTGANDVWVVEGPLGEVLLPVIEEVVLEVDYERRTATVRLLPGLLDEEDAL